MIVHPLNGHYATFKNAVIHDILFSEKRTVYIMKSSLSYIVFIYLYVFFILRDVWRSIT